MRIPLLPLLAAGSILGCVPGEDPAPPLRVGLLVWPGYEPAFLARDLGWLDQGRVTLVEYRTPAEVLRAFRRGDLDGAAMTANHLLELRVDRPEVRGIMVLDVSAGGDALLARSTLGEIAELRGRRVGVEASALGAFMLHRALTTAGLEVTDVDVVPIDVMDHLTAWTEGRVDAVVTYEPMRSRMLELEAHVLFDSEDITGEIVDVMMTTSGCLERRRDDWIHFVESWFAALDRLGEQPLDSAERIAPREGVTPERFLEMLDGLELPDARRNATLLGEDDRLTRTLTDLRDLMVDMEHLPRSSRPVQDALDPSLMREVLTRR